jgi:hypothetical protein
MTRSNGLGASSFVPVAEFSPGLDDTTAQDLLDRLERVGVAAYLEPMAAGDMLLVDARRTRTAAALLTRALQDESDDPHDGLPPHPMPAGGDGAPLAEDERLLWSQLMADFDTAPSGDGWPTAEGEDGFDEDPPDENGTPGDEPHGQSGRTGPTGGPPSMPPIRLRRMPPPGRPVARGHVSDRAGAGQVEPNADAVADDFEPEPPPPMPRPTVTVAVGWICATVVPLLVVVLGFVGVPLPLWSLLIAGGFFVYGLVILFGQLRSEPEIDDAGDDDQGARI